MRPEYLISDTRRHAAATAHADAAPRLKRYASLLGVTDRTARRHRSVHEAKGSPLYRHFEYLEAVEDPWRIAAATMAKAHQLTLATWRDSEIIDRIRALHVEDATGEGVDNANRARRKMTWLERAADTERDAAIDLELAALYRECAVRKIGEDEVFGA